MGSLAACTSGPPAGTDGDLADNWGSLPPAVAYLPTAGTCDSSTPGPVAAIWNAHPVACTGEHNGETVYVSQLSGAVASLPVPPKADNPGLLPAWRDCDREATTFVGRPWSDARLELYLVLPTENAWKSGSHWFRCDLNEVKDVDDYLPTSRTGSLQAPLDPKLLIGCLQTTSDKNDLIVKEVVVACTAKHNAEYVGSIWSTLAAYPTKDTQFRPLFNACYSKIDAYVGMKNTRTGTFIARAASDDQWKAGYRVVRCYLWLDKKTMSKSAKGTKGKGVPTF
ncbi:hypothetical protein F4553_006622 [Allocatelliglobosispora scoriae]|uniref:Septum formation-related domain-containing protein n=1 Tax=Allocatelliglobosispora scoriae TaxID=643052 RepID=A0A841C0B9_9ACTN|nr:septum formation family protein [Allocatelliglobosispora scoriae]MBB5873188.1 hypothetical protein [Allocatelliglobosispora scoriae]